MYGAAAMPHGGSHDVVCTQVRLGGGEATKVGAAGTVECVRRAGVGCRPRANSLHPQALGSARDASRDLAAVGDEQPA